MFTARSGNPSGNMLLFRYAGIPGRRPLEGKEAPRIVQAAEAYPRRWTHHVLVENEADLDGELMGWIDEAFQFSIVK